MNLAFSPPGPLRTEELEVTSLSRISQPVTFSVEKKFLPSLVTCSTSTISIPKIVTVIHQGSLDAFRGMSKTRVLLVKIQWSLVHCDGMSEDRWCQLNEGVVILGVSQLALSGASSLVQIQFIYTETSLHAPPFICERKYSPSPLLVHMLHRATIVRPLTVFLSVVATSVFALLRTFWNSETRKRMRECMYAFEHLMW